MIDFRPEWQKWLSILWKPLLLTAGVIAIVYGLCYWLNTIPEPKQGITCAFLLAGFGMQVLIAISSRVGDLVREQRETNKLLRDMKWRFK